jgi:hypothetical protein
MQFHSATISFTADHLADAFPAAGVSLSTMSEMLESSQIGATVIDRSENDKRIRFSISCLRL